MSANSEMITFCVKLPNSFYQRFHKIAELLGTSKSVIARKALRQALAQAEKDLKHYGAMR